MDEEGQKKKKERKGKEITRQRHHHLRRVKHCVLTSRWLGILDSVPEVVCTYEVRVRVCRK